VKLLKIYNEKINMRRLFYDIFQEKGEKFGQEFYEIYKINQFNINQESLKKHGRLLLKKYIIDDKIIIDATKSNAIISKDSDSKGNYVKIYYKDLAQK